jgi:hypothetical protein
MKGSVKAFTSGDNIALRLEDNDKNYAEVHMTSTQAILLVTEILSAVQGVKDLE